MSRSQVQGLVGLLTGALLLVLATQPLLRGRWADLGLAGYPEACSAWQSCPGQVFSAPVPSDTTMVLPWVTCVAVVVAMLMPVLHAKMLGRTIVWMSAVALWLSLGVATQDRHGGYLERNVQFEMQPTWAWYAMVAVQAVAVAAFELRRRHERSRAQLILPPTPGT